MDAALFADYAMTVREILGQHPSADVLSDTYNENVTRSVHYMVQLANDRFYRPQPEDTAGMDASIRDLREGTGMAPPGNWRG